MQYYNIKLRLNGSTSNEVFKTVSAPELLVLQYIHGSDAVVNVDYDHTDRKLSNTEEKLRLKATYDQALIKREQSIDGIFGALGILPAQLPDEVMEMFGIVTDPNDAIEVAKAATRKSKNYSAKVEREKKNDLKAEMKAQGKQAKNNALTADEVDLDDLVVG